MSLKENKTRIAISLTKEQLKKIGQISGEMGISKSNLIVIATLKYIEKYEEKKKSSASLRS